MRLAYIVHDVADPAVARRVAMLKGAGAQVALLGFCRDKIPPADVAGERPIVLGRTRDGDFMGRAVSVAVARARAHGHSAAVGRVDAIIARNLETLPFALSLRDRSPERPRLIYEVLDIHDLLLGEGPLSRLLRAGEGRLTRQADLLLTSSPAFVSAYFAPRSAVRLPIHIVENKLLPGQAPPRVEPLPAGPPWRIGLFGALRCRRSLDLLTSLADRLDGRVEVVVRGRPSPAVFPDLAQEVAQSRHVTFEGPYRNPDELPAIYGDVHFVWAMDFFQAGGNSEWLLPNRLYEAGATATVPLARAGTETAAVLERNEFGVVFDEPLLASLADFFDGLDAARYTAETRAVERVPRERFVASEDDARDLLAAIAGRPRAVAGLAA